MTDTARQQFCDVVAVDDDAIDVAAAALWVAAEEFPSLDVAAYLDRLDALADAARSRVAARGDVASQVDALNEFLFVEEGFQGNRAEYYDPRNSYLNCVLDRRTGIPITLSVVYVEVARRLGLVANGIGFPGHFLSRVAANPDLIVDPFVGVVLSDDECRERLMAVAGPSVVLRPEVHLRAANPREIVVRLLSNLKQVFVAQEDLERALACCDRILIAAPELVSELRDRGIVYARLGYFAAAAADLEHFLEQAPDDESAPSVEQHLASARLQMGRLH